MHMKRRGLPVLAVVVLWGVVTASVSAAPIFFGPTPYLSAGDIPAGFYAGGVPTALENFEDGTLDFGITPVFGDVIPPGLVGIIDSVDGDDGVIDGSGLLGHSWFHIGGSVGGTFTFSGPLPTAAGMVWTDGAGTATFTAFGPGMVSIGTIGPVPIGDGISVITGETAEDRFFGVQDPGGILAIKLSNTDGGIEVDHVQFGTAPSASAVPEPATLALFSLGAVGMRLSNRRRAARLIAVG
jgi:hypothetical protein